LLLLLRLWRSRWSSDRRPECLDRSVGGSSGDQQAERRQRKRPRERRRREHHVGAELRQSAGELGGRGEGVQRCRHHPEAGAEPERRGQLVLLGGLRRRRRLPAWDAEGGYPAGGWRVGTTPSERRQGER